MKQKKSFYTFTTFLALVGLVVFIAFQGIVSDITSLGMYIFSMPSLTYHDAREFLISQEEMSKNYESIKKQKEQYEILSQNMNAIKEENRKLKDTLQLGNTFTDFDLEYANISIRSVDDWQNTLIIDKGETSGIKDNMAVIANGGLIGRILHVSKTTATVSLLTSKSTDRANVHSLVSDTSQKQVAGVVSNYEKDNRWLVFQPTDAGTFATDQVVTTSGLGGVFPNGVPIGKIVSGSNSNYQNNKQQYLIEPYANFNQISVVMIAKLKE